MFTQHAVVWIDHEEARIFPFSREQADAIRVRTTLAHHRIHNKAGSIDGKRVTQNKPFHEEVVEALEHSEEWLIVGPGNAKDELAKHIRDHHPELQNRIVGVETVDHPTEAQILAHARRFFRAADRMIP